MILVAMSGFVSRDLFFAMNKNQLCSESVFISRFKKH